VSEAMSIGVRSVREDTPVTEVLNLMGSAEIRRVPVVNNNDEIVGIVSPSSCVTRTNARQHLYAFSDNSPDEGACLAAKAPGAARPTSQKATGRCAK